jgi:sigma-B regulation protein RsbU (phosphoserine phosphatase)
MEDTEYKQAKVTLAPGDIVVLYTDGVTEMRNDNEEEYGQKRVGKLIAENSHLGADQIVSKLIEDLEAFRGTKQPHDDTTALVFKKSF